MPPYWLLEILDVFGLDYEMFVLGKRRVRKSVGLHFVASYRGSLNS